MNLRIESKPFHMGIDAWVFVVVFAGYAYALHDSPALVAILFATLLVYLIADGNLSSSLEWRVKFFILIFTIGLFVFGFGILEITLRHTTAPYRFVHDGLIQTEEAVKFLLAGKNPYVENYTYTPMANWDFRIGKLTSNPALYHNPYLPFLFLFNLPFYMLFNSVLGWYDGRMVFLLMFLGTLLMLKRWVKDRGKRFALLLFFALNPFFVTYLIEGRNDIFVLFWIVLGVDLIRRKHETLALIALGLACASKLTAWFLIPFYGLYLFQPRAETLWPWLRANAFPILRRMMPLIATMTLILLPFLLWQPEAFVDDIWFYQNGMSTIAPYPISGYGFNTLAQTLGWLSPDATRSPFEILQWVIGLPVLILLSWRQIKINTLPQMWLSYGLLIAVMAFFSHTLNDSHIGFILTLFSFAAFSDDARSPLPAVETANVVEV